MTKFSILHVYLCPVILTLLAHKEVLIALSWWMLIWVEKGEGYSQGHFRRRWRLFIDLWIKWKSPK